ncbi:MAG: acyltransferase [Armatimonadetes bacterium]|nr:acyltransferase [Armatimonadota bacterium]
MISLPGDKPANWAAVERHVATAAAAGAQLVVFPECCITGYWHLRKLSREALWELAEPVPNGDSCERLRALARQHDLLVGVGFIERDEASGRLYKTWAAALPDGRLHWHHKLHAFVSRHLTCGDQYTVFDTPWGWRVGVLICYDCNLGENVRCTALLGADVLLAPHQTGGCGSPNPHQMGLVDRALWDRRADDPAAIEAELAGPKGRGWLMRWLPARAHDNGLFLVFSNGVGPDDDEIRTGNAMVLDPYGRVLSETCRAGDDIVTATLDPALFHLNTGRRWLRSRRPELYGLLAQATGREVDTRTALREEKDFAE